MNLVKTVGLAFLFCFALSCVASADSFTGTSLTGAVEFTGVDVFSVAANSSVNPFGVTQVTCPGGGPCQSNFAGSFEVANVIFFADGGFIIVPTANAGNGNSSGTWENGPAPSSSIYSISGATLGSLVAGTSETANPSVIPNMTTTDCTGGSPFTGWCFNGTAQGGGSVLTYLGSTDPNGVSGVFTAVDNSEEVAFALASSPVTTPEPSTLLMLGAALFSFVGFGLRRRPVD